MTQLLQQVIAVNFRQGFKLRGVNKILQLDNPLTKLKLLRRHAARPPDHHLAGGLSSRRVSSATSANFPDLPADAERSFSSPCAICLIAGACAVARVCESSKRAICLIPSAKPGCFLAADRVSSSRITPSSTGPG